VPKPEYVVYESSGGPVRGGDLNETYRSAEDALRVALAKQVEGVVLCSEEILPLLERCDPPDREYSDFVHAGFQTGSRGAFESLCMASLGWFFLDPPRTTVNSSWKASSHLCWFKPPLARKIGGLDDAYRSTDARLMDLAYRLLILGGRVRHDPRWIRKTDPANFTIQIGLEDEFIFTIRHIGFRAAIFLTFSLMTLGRSPSVVLSALFKARRLCSVFPRPLPELDFSNYLDFLGGSTRQRVGSISAIIPTIDRYEYLGRSIQSLLDQEPKPDEVIVVDQTPQDRRQPEVYEGFPEDVVSVVYLDEAGQAVARNEAIRRAKGEWCLLFEDDTTAWEGMIGAHIRAVELTGASASTGISLAPWKTVEDIATKNSYYRVSDILSTGNCLVRKNALDQVGCLDRAFDRGPGADHDLGIRLYLAGNEIVLNPEAVQTHYKASTGGMRNHGAWWRHRATLMAPYPPPTQIHTSRKYYPSKMWKSHYLMMFLLAHTKSTRFEYVWLWIAAPWKLGTALRRANRLKSDGGSRVVQRV
jgi:glycosyltransferase involved in cell wall biosynthesis